MDNIIKKKRQADIAFRAYDRNGDGFITKNEMQEISGSNLSKDQIDKVRRIGVKGPP